MKLIELKLKNFKSYPDVEQSLQLDHVGVKLCVARNGAGKSALVNEAAIWCLYGKTLQDSVDDVVNRYTKKNCKVSVRFSVNDEEYTVFRYRKHDTHGNAVYIFKGDENISSKNSVDTQSIIQDILQIPYNAFINSIIFSSELYTSFMRAKTGDRLKIIESILSLKEIAQLYEITKKRIAEQDEFLSLKNTEIEKVKSGLNMLETTIFEYKETAKNRLLAYKKERNDNLSLISSLEMELANLNKIDVVKELSLIEIKEKNILINKEIKDEWLKKIDKENLVKKLNDIKTKLEKLSKIDVEKELETIKSNSLIKEEIVTLENTKKIAEKSFVPTTQLEKEINRLIKSIISNDAELNQLKENKCHVCGHLLDEDKNKELTNNKTLEIENNKFQLEKITQEHKEALSKNNLLEEEIVSLNNRIKELKEKLVYTDFTADKLEIIKKDISELSIQVAIKGSEIESANKFNNEIDSKINKLKESLLPEEETNYTKDFITKLKTIIDEKTEQIQELNAKNNTIDSIAKTVFDKSFVDEKEKQAIKLKKELSKLEKEALLIKNELAYYKVFSVIFSNKEAGFKKYFIGKMISAFNESVNFYLPLFFHNPIKIEFDKDLNETITYDENIVSFSSFSSGQKTRVEIAISFALFNLVKIFFSADTNLIVLDEILDANLDNDGFEAVVEIVEGMAKTNSIFIVSHREEYKERFPDKIEIELEDGKFSKIKENK